MSESGHSKVCQVLLAMQNKHNCGTMAVLLSPAALMMTGALASSIFANTEALQEEDDR